MPLVLISVDKVFRADSQGSDVWIVNGWAEAAKFDFLSVGATSNGPIRPQLHPSLHKIIQSKHFKNLATNCNLKCEIGLVTLQHSCRPLFLVRSWKTNWLQHFQKLLWRKHSIHTRSCSLLSTVTLWRPPNKATVFWNSNWQIWPREWKHWKCKTSWDLRIDYKRYKMVLQPV